MHDPAHHQRRGPPGCVVRAAGPIRHPGRSLVRVALGPPVGRSPADLKSLGGPSSWPALDDDGAGQPQSAELAQGCVTVGHEDLLGQCGCLAAPHQTRRSSLQQLPPGPLAPHQPPWAVQLAQRSGAHSPRLPGVAAHGPLRGVERPQPPRP
jgi:hypothetical protein